MPQNAGRSRRAIARLLPLLLVAVGALGMAQAPVHAETVPSCEMSGSLWIGGVFHSTMGTGGIPGVSVWLAGPGGCRSHTTSGPRGGYRFQGLGSGMYALFPFRAGCGFDPPHRTVTLSTHGAVASFDATCV